MHSSIVVSVFCLPFPFLLTCRQLRSILLIKSVQFDGNLSESARMCLLHSAEVTRGGMRIVFPSLEEVRIRFITRSLFYRDFLLCSMSCIIVSCQSVRLCNAAVVELSSLIQRHSVSSLRQQTAKSRYTPIAQLPPLSIRQYWNSNIAVCLLFAVQMNRQSAVVVFQLMVLISSGNALLWSLSWANTKYL